MFGIGRNVLHEALRRGRAERRALRRVGVEPPVLAADEQARIEELAELGELRTAVVAALAELGIALAAGARRRARRSTSSRPAARRRRRRCSARSRSCAATVGQATRCRPRRSRRCGGSASRPCLPSLRLLRSTPSGGRAWVVPVPDVGSGFPFLCRAAHSERKPRERLAVVAIGDAAQGGGGALADLARGRATVSTDQCSGQGHDMLSVSGRVPDGVAAVFLTAPDGTAVRADVKDNACEFVVAHPRRPQQRYVVWTGGDGTPHVQPVVASATPRARLCEQISELETARPRVSPGPGSGGACAVTPVLTVPVSPKLAPPAVRRVRPGRPLPAFVGCGPVPPVVLTAPPAVPKRHK